MSGWDDGLCVEHARYIAEQCGRCASPRWKHRQRWQRSAYWPAACAAFAPGPPADGPGANVPATTPPTTGSHAAQIARAL